MTEVVTSRAKSLAGLLAIVAMMALIVFPSFAYAQSASEHVSGTQSYDSSSDAWTGGTGAVDIVYDTSGGTWQDPGTNPADPQDNVSHDNGTYIITLPKLISYTGMNIGAVNTSDNYTVNVRGAIESGKKVFVTAETNKALSADGDAGIVETTTQGKTEWTTDECMGTINADGSLSGTNSTDTIALSGVAKVAGDYVGYVQYNATVMSDAEAAQAKAQAIADTANSFAKHGTDGTLTWWIDESDGTLYYAPTDGVSGIHSTSSTRSCSQYQDLVTRIVCLEGVNIGVESYKGVYLLGIYMTWPNLTTVDVSRANVGTGWNFNQVEYALSNKESLTFITPPNQPAGDSHPMVCLSGNGSFRMTNPSTGIQYYCYNGGTAMQFVGWEPGVFDNNTMVADGVWIITDYSTT